jgi:cell division inhibitor SepF
MNVLDKFKDFMGLNEEYDYDESDDEAYSSGEYAPAEPAAAPKPAEEERRPANAPRPVTGIDSIRSTKNNVVGMPGMVPGISEMVLIEPRSFEEMPQVIDALRQRKSVILNMTLIRQEEAQRSVDFVAGGAHAIDGHYERIGDNIFLFTPSCVQVSSIPANAINEVVNQQVPLTTQTTRAARSTEFVPTWGTEPLQAAAQ